MSFDVLTPERRQAIQAFLREYDGPPLRIMEVCGTHTERIARLGIPSLLSSKLHLISGPGCPVCVTVTSYIDRLIELAMMPRTTVVTFGDLMRVPGSRFSLNEARGQGASVRYVYSPLDLVRLAESEPDRAFVFAAVGFETTAAAYIGLLERMVDREIRNIRLLTSIKVMPPVIDWVMGQPSNIDAMLAPGHVSVIIGAAAYRPLAEKWSRPFAVAGFDQDDLMLAIYGLTRAAGRGVVMNLYPRVVSEQGNLAAQEGSARFFEAGDATWRGFGTIPGSGLYLRPEWSGFDAGSKGLDEDEAFNRSCRCGQVLTGTISPTECPLFGTACSPEHPQGACMISSEGSCHSYYVGDH